MSTQGHLALDLGAESRRAILATFNGGKLAIGETTGAASAYVAMTRGRNSNHAHLVADNLDEARQQWIRVFSRDRADLGPAHLQRLALDAIDRYGPTAPRPPGQRSPLDAHPRPASRPSGIGL